MLWSRGFAAQETQAAFKRAKELAENVQDASERFATYYGVWLVKFSGGELALARQNAETFLREATLQECLGETAVAARIMGVTRLVEGDFVGARAYLKEALKKYIPERDRELKFRFGLDTKACTTIYNAQAAWLLGEFALAQSLIQEATARAEELAHIPTQANVLFFKAMFEMFRGDAEATQRVARTVIDLSQEHGLSLYLSYAKIYLHWADTRLGVQDRDAAELRIALMAYTEQGNKLYVPLYEGLLAELEADAGDLTGALGRIEAALALAGETGEHWTDSFLHRIRGEILLNGNPANTAQAEDAFLTAIVVAQQQKARSFELRAALSLAQLYQSIDRAADGHDVLAPALGGFTPMPEFPEIVEAQTLLSELAEADELKNAAAARERRLKLQTNYGQAMMWSKGYAAEETKAAFARARPIILALRPTSITSRRSSK